MARRTGRFPQLAHSRSGLKRPPFATITPPFPRCKNSRTAKYLNGPSPQRCLFLEMKGVDTSALSQLRVGDALDAS
jgi:hypothetical protein